MTRKFQFFLAVIACLCWINYGIAQTPLNEVKIGQCSSAGKVDEWIKTEVGRGLVMDSRPFAINQSSGKLLFTRGQGRVSVVHMNPFVYNYKISVAQQELVSTALTDFLKLLLPQSLGSLPGLQTGDAGGSASIFPRTDQKLINKLRLIDERLRTFKLADCITWAGNDEDKKAACAATNEMFRVFDEIRQSVDPSREVFVTLDTSTINADFKTFSKSVMDLRNEQSPTYETCQKGGALNLSLLPYKENKVFEELNKQQKEISRINSVIDDLLQLTSDYNKDLKLKDKIVRCSGFNCTNQLIEYVTAVREVLGGSGYQGKLDDQRRKAQEMQNMFVFTEQMRTKDGLFARTFDVAKKFELSQATISVKREKVVKEQEANANKGSQSGTTNSEQTNTGTGTGNGTGGPSEGTAGDSFGPSFVPPGLQAGSAPNPAPTPTTTPTPVNANNANALAGEVNEVIQLGRPRFMLSGGMVYSPLPRRTFKSVKGFVLDAQGNPTGNGDANVIGYGQNSSRRLFPMVMLNSRLWDYEQGSLYFSVGVTGKKDNNVDIEYLLGPSVSFLNDRALFTFGAYGGLTQNLVDNVKVGDAIPDAIGDAIFYRKGLTWKPGFSFSYSFSKPKKREASGSSGGSAAADELKNEIRIGSVPFNFALGLAFTSLEQRTYDEVAGYARNRQGNLTNGQTLARIVGLASSSNYRLAPLAMLHSRLTNFGRHDFYFTTGITGKKTDNDFDVEYLLGGSVNIYGRKLFLTFGTFVGKQQVLGGSFFEGAALAKTQNVTTQDRYVWKPAFAFSYDISRIIPK